MKLGVDAKKTQKQQQQNNKKNPQQQTLAIIRQNFPTLSLVSPYFYLHKLVSLIWP